MAVLSEHQRDILKTVSTATVTTLLLKQGIRRSWMRGPRPFAEAQARMVGEAVGISRR